MDSYRCNHRQKQLFSALLNRFDPDAQFNLLRTDKPPGT